MIKSNSSFQGYDLFYERIKTTCANDRANLIASYKPVTFSNCRCKCDLNENCAFLFINDVKYCELYRSCEINRTTHHTGSTYKDVKGNILTKI